MEKMVLNDLKTDHERVLQNTRENERKEGRKEEKIEANDPKTELIRYQHVASYGDHQTCRRS